MRLIATLVTLLAVSAPALAQSVGPLPPVVVDVRGFYAGLGQDPVVAAGLGVSATDLPARGLGALVGVHGYPFRRGRLAVGVGGDFVTARGRAQRETDTGQPAGDPVQQRLRGVSGNLSINFGDRNGWSYLTAGLGPLTFATFVGETAPADAAPSKMTINLGGGARWFASRHVAFSVDVRFYLTRPERITASYPGRERTRLTMVSAGVSFQ